MSDYKRLTEPETTEQILEGAGYSTLSLKEIEATLRKDGYCEQFILETLSFVIDGRELLRLRGRSTTLQ